MKFLIFKDLIYEHYLNIKCNSFYNISSYISIIYFFSVILVQKEIYLLLYHNKRSWTIVLCKLMTTQLLDAVITQC